MEKSIYDDRPGIIKSIRSPGSITDMFQYTDKPDSNIVIGNKVEMRRISYKCPRCGSGYMKYTGRTFITYPPTFEHECTVCHFADSYERIYPGYVAIDVYDEE